MTWVQGFCIREARIGIVGSEELDFVMAASSNPISMRRKKKFIDQICDSAPQGSSQK